ncbi:hypothetical protein L332_03590 [Agrococcus pavilionensis RW1]|uniref:Uncharacterized protein n=1 Tax=Agrococcus pavilionensis RW1 TaxID=1330458 RepID=U1LMG4_9MICO|nr:hypothetical protein [Agrococcus pavilionensis]ERG63534.1 hypothetical protein L332_03590 [Agrococcus pavilionensis RW1]
MIRPTDLGTSDLDLARRVLARGRRIAPYIDEFPDDSEERLTAIAILKAVVAEFPAPGERRVKSMSRNGTSVSYGDVGSAFTADVINELRALEPDGWTADASLPVGHFPLPGITARMWPELYG